MKKKCMMLLLCLSLLALAAGCGTAQTPPAAPAEEGPSAQTPEAPPAPSGEEDCAARLPAGVTPQPSETEPLPALAQAIIKQYEIPEEEWGNTRYYYNYVDLNGDGTDEIFAVVIGAYTSGTGGDSALWVIPTADMAIQQAFTLVRTPIIVTAEATNGQEFGAKGLVMERAGGGAKAEYVMLTCADGQYTTVNDAQPVEDYEALTGTAIICNDLAADWESGNYLTLAN